MVRLQKLEKEEVDAVSSDSGGGFLCGNTSLGLWCGLQGKLSRPGSVKSSFSREEEMKGDELRK